MDGLFPGGTDRIRELNLLHNILGKRSLLISADLSEFLNPQLVKARFYYLKLESHFPCIRQTTENYFYNKEKSYKQER
jgi:hypothetical protein